jgi:tRNA-modifying protein YgfZ
MPDPQLLQGAARLSDWGLIQAEGPDAASFLHGQLTQAVVGLPSQRHSLAALCSAKGRMLASFVLWQAQPERYVLACSAELVPATVQRLRMFVLRAKCKIEDLSAELGLWGLAGPSVAPWLAEQGLAAEALSGPGRWAALADGRQVLRATDACGQARYLLVQPAQAPVPALQAMTSAAWSWLEVHSGVARVLGGTTEHFVPQMVNFELVGGVNFQKGCYPGQEVVARSQYRGTLKRRGFVLSGLAPMQPAQEIFHSDDPTQPCGEVVLAASLGDEHVAFAELKIASTLGGSLHLVAADGPRLHLGTLPYALPTEPA